MHARLADPCLSTYAHTAQIHTEEQFLYISDGSRAAVDGQAATYSCTQDNEAFPWWAVDLGQEYDIGSVRITLPDVNGDKRNYHRPGSIY